MAPVVLVFGALMGGYFSQNLLKSAGVKGQRTVFLLTDAQIKEEAFLEDVDSVLNTGEVPNLFAVDEKQEIMEVNMFECVKIIYF